MNRQQSLPPCLLTNLQAIVSICKYICLTVETLEMHQNELKESVTVSVTYFEGNCK